MLTEKVVQHVVDSLRESYADRGWSQKDLDSLERRIRRRAEQVRLLIDQVQGWARADEVEYDILCTLLGHLPSVHLYFENPFMMQMRIPLGELLLTLSDTIHENGELEGFEVVPNDCPDLQDPSDELSTPQGSTSLRDSSPSRPEREPREPRESKDGFESVNDDDLKIFRKAFEDM